MMLAKPNMHHGAEKHSHQHLHRMTLNEGEKSDHCASLTNHETYFTVEVQVGTPPQKFELVADTGSDSVIIPSCICVDSAACNTGKNDRCFKGHGHSSTFNIKEGPNGPPTAVLTFGSGQIEAAVATDVVRVAGTEANMHNGLLLMTDQALSIESAFQGILGLGPPKHDAVGVMVAGHAEQGHIEYADGGRLGHHRGHGNSSAVAKHESSLRGALTEKKAVVSQHGQPVPRAKSFLKEAGVRHFSLCYNDNGQPGALRLATSPMPDALKSLGTEHWSLNLKGVSISGSNKKMSLCRGKDKQMDWETACVAVPDSGTTVLAAPQDHIVEVLNNLCDEWPRCSSNYTRMLSQADTVHDLALTSMGWDPWDVKATSKAEVMVALLQDCRKWVDESKDGINELPPLRFHVAGKDGESVALELGPSDYIFEVDQKQVSMLWRLASNSSASSSSFRFMEEVHNDHEEDDTAQSNKNKRRTCIPAMEAIDYVDPQFGQMWILGMPFFYSYNVHYTLSEEDPSIAFRNTPCDTCGGSANSHGPDTSFQAGGSGANEEVTLESRAPLAGFEPSRYPRSLTKPIRLPRWVLQRGKL
eukprot:CAMPEP_0178420584 /NCGR_PEP_ID=MMETSP0689_2-20121128/26208_1 /TAXON_ID=160604 /ORGANISM="Amphidinium massartii, Strain CS-259" /LENGTH=585 /DNA_ID=CAMNT_0020042071 /DNA_START=210 /DNA_END=1967 /DNA_ORIENTATION=-